MDFGFAIIIDFAMNTDKLNRLMDVIVEFPLLTFRKSYQKVKQHRFWLWDHNGLHHEHWQDQPDQLGGEGDGRDYEVPDFFPKVYRNINAENYKTSLS